MNATIRWILCVCAIALLAAPLGARAQEGEVQQKFFLPKGRILLFSDTNYRGIAKGFDKGVPNLAAVGFNNLAASLSLQPGERWQICQDTDYRNCQVVSKDVPNLLNLGMLRKISSIRPDGGSSGDKYVPPLKGRSATFFPTPRLNDRPVAACPGGGNSRRCMEDQTDKFCRKAGYREGAYFSNRNGYLEDVLCLR